MRFDLCDYCCGCCCSVSSIFEIACLKLTSCRSFTLFVSVFAAVGLVGGKRGGFIELRGESDEYSDEPLPGLESLEKM